MYCATCVQPDPERETNQRTPPLSCKMKSLSSDDLHAVKKFAKIKREVKGIGARGED